MVQRIPLFSLLLLTACGNGKLPNQRMFVQSIESGKEIDMMRQGQVYRLKLCGVDVPKSQDSQARNLLGKLTEQADEQEKGLVVVPVRSQGNTITAELYAPTTNQDEEKSVDRKLLRSLPKRE